MFWPIERRAVPDGQTPTWSMFYLASCPVPSDPTMIWGTDFPSARLAEYLKKANADSDVLISAAHVLLRAVGRCLAEHPEFNRRVLRRRLFQYRQVHVLMPIQGGPHGPEVCVLLNVDRMSVADIARDLWRQSREIAKGTSTYARDDRLFRLIPRWLRGLLFRHVMWSNRMINWPAALWGKRTISSSTMVNYLGFHGPRRCGASSKAGSRTRPC